MITFNPRITIRRLVITKGGRTAYDQEFHDGVNIIRGDNGTGKSTIMEFIFYGIGGSVGNWTKEARSCDNVFCEVILNDKVFTFSRDIVDQNKSKMAIFEGNYEAAISNKEKWLVFPYARNEFKKSFSQIIFDILGMPYHKTDDYANLTLHQLLRLIYVDQITPPTMIFRQEEIFDSESSRVAIGEYLLGLDDLEVHKLRQELLRYNKDFDEINGELKALYNFLGAQNVLLNESSVMNEIANISKEIETKKYDIEQQKAMKTQELEPIIANKSRELQGEILLLTEQITGILDEKEVLVTDIMDINLFLSALKERIKCLEESEITQLELGSLSFRYCPVCLSLIKEHAQDQCYLCKNTSPRSGENTPYLRMRRDLDFQLMESQKVSEVKKKRLDEINAKTPIISNELNKKRAELNFIYQSSTYADATTGNLLQEIGYLHKSVDTLKEKLIIAQNLDILSGKKQELQGRIDKAKSRIQQMQIANTARREAVNAMLSKFMLDIIQRDDFEPEFKNAEEFDYNFGKNKTEINGRSKFSASSMVYMKNSFRLAVLLSSLQDPKIRFPRFLLMDNIEDKGMQPARSNSFQYALVDSCEEQKVSFQIIFTTSMIAPELDDSSRCVGPFYKKGMHTLMM